MPVGLPSEPEVPRKLWSLRKSIDLLCQFPGRLPRLKLFKLHLILLLPSPISHLRSSLTDKADSHRGCRGGLRRSESPLNIVLRGPIPTRASTTNCRHWSRPDPKPGSHRSGGPQRRDTPRHAAYDINRRGLTRLSRAAWAKTRARLPVCTFGCSSVRLAGPSSRLPLCHRKSPWPARLALQENRVARRRLQSSLKWLALHGRRCAPHPRHAYEAAARRRLCSPCLRAQRAEREHWSNG